MICETPALVMNASVCRLSTVCPSVVTVPLRRLTSMMKVMVEGKDVSKKSP